MPTKRNRLYWDAMCFIYLFNRTAHIPAEWLSALETTYEDMLAGKVWIVTCDLFRTEVWGNQLTGAALQAYNDLLGCRHFEIVTLRSSTYELARDYRQNCNAVGQNLRTPDSLHLASANQIRVNEFWTTDNNLINKYNAGHIGTIKVCHPHANQLRLDL